MKFSYLFLASSFGFISSINCVQAQSLSNNIDLLARPKTTEQVKIEKIIPLSLKQALEIAQENNQQLQIAKQKLESSRIALRAAQGTLLPTLSFSGGISYQKLASLDYVDSQISTAAGQLGPIGELATKVLADTSLKNLTTPYVSPVNASLLLNYNLDVSGERAISIETAAKQVQISELELKRQSEDTRLATTLDYYTLQEADELIKISQAAIVNAKEILEDAQNLYAAKVGTRLDVLRSQVILANNNEELSLSQSLQLNARRRIVQRLNLPETVTVKTTDPVEMAGKWTLSLDQSIIQAYKNRNELDQILVQEDILKDQQKLAQLSLAPKVNLFGSLSALNILDSNPNPGINNGYAVGAVLLWNLYDGGVSQANAQLQGQNQLINQTRFSQTRNEIRTQVEQSYNDLQSNLVNIQTSLVAIDRAKEALRLARMGFSAGVVTQLDTTTSQTDLTRAQTNYLRAVINYNRAFCSLERAVGNY